MVSSSSGDIVCYAMLTNQRRVSHVHNMLDLSMVCFPYVVMGVGQAVIAGTTMSRKRINNADDIQGRRITRLTFDRAALRENNRTRSGSPVLLPS